MQLFGYQKLLRRKACIVWAFLWLFNLICLAAISNADPAVSPIIRATNAPVADVSTNLDTAAKVAAAALAQSSASHGALINRVLQFFQSAAQSMSAPETAKPRTSAQTRGPKQATDQPEKGASQPDFLERWLLFGLVVVFLGRRIWRYYYEEEEDDDFANHLATLAVAYRWVFPVYMILLTAVAVAEFLQFGSFYLSLSVLMLASSLRRYYCEADFANYPFAQKIHFALSLALVGFAWTIGRGPSPWELGTWFSWPVGGWILAFLSVRVFSGFYNDSDLAQHRQTLFFFLGGFLICGAIGGAFGYTAASKQGHGISPLAAAISFGILACFPLGIIFWRWWLKVAQDRLDGGVFDMFFSEASFSEKPRRLKHLPPVQLLRHWRDHGEIEKAWHTAEGHLMKEPRAVPVWLFALETAILYRRKPDDAKKILSRLCATEEIHYDHRTVAVAEVQAWMAEAGFPFDPAQFKVERPPLLPTELSNKVDLKIRAGRFGEAALMLRAVLQDDSLNEPAFIQLVRLYAQDLKNRPAAERLIAEARDTFGPSLLDFLERSLDDWIQLPIRSSIKPKKFFSWLRRKEPNEPASKKLSIVSPPITQAAIPAKISDPINSYLDRVKQSQATPPAAVGPVDSVEKLLLERRLGTAVEILKEQAEAAPDNFELWHRYAEAQGHHCGNPTAAEKILRQMERSGHFKKAQLRKTHNQLRKWRKKHAGHQDNW